MMVPINFLALLVCGVIAVVLGMLWYGPLFGKPWRKTMGVTDEQVAEMRKDTKAQQAMMKSAGIAFVFALITAFVLQHFITFGGAYMQDMSLSGALQGAFWAWLGFAVPVLTGAVLWESKTWKWWGITISYYLVLWLLMAAVLNLWT